MSDRAPLVPLAGSTRVSPPHQETGACDPETPATITLYVRGSGDEPVPGRLSREEYAAAHGAATSDVDAVRAFASHRGLTVGHVDSARRSVELAGSLDALAGAFGTTLSLFQDTTGLEYRARNGPLFVPAELGDVVTGVFGLDERPQARPQFRPRANATSQYTPPQVAAAYAFPAGTHREG